MKRRQAKFLFMESYHLSNKQCASVSVAVEPVEFVRPLQDHRVTRLGEDYTFEVELSRDHGRAQWLRDGMEIRADRKYNIWNEAAHHKLTIREVDDRDAGDYAILVKGHRSAARSVKYNSFHS